MDRAHLVFLKVAETGNMTSAARELNVAQPSLTRTISALERDFGTALFKRLPRGMELTAAGHTLRRHLEEMNAVYQRARRDVEAVRQGYFETVRIGAGLTYQLLLMPKVLAGIWERFPRTSFQVSTGSAQTHTQMLLDGDLDIAITAAVEEYTNPSLDVRLLGRIHHGVAHRPGTLPDIPPDRPMPLEALQDRDWVLFQAEPELSVSLNQRFFRLGLPSPRVALVSSSLQVGLDVMRDRGLIMSVPTILRQRLADQGFLVHETSEPLWELDSGIATHSANRDHPVLSALIELIEASVDEMTEFASDF